MAVLEIVETITDSLLAFAIRICLWVFVALLAPSWVAVLVLIGIVLIPLMTVTLEDVAEIFQPVVDLVLILTALFAIHGILDWKGSLALVALFGLPLMYNVYL